jgi:hypothetical protein
MPLPEAPPAFELPLVAGEFETAAGANPGKAFSIIRPRCAAGAAGEIVVCAADPKRNRLHALPDSPPEGLPRAEARLSENATIDLHTESAQISGAPSNRAMVGIKIGF